MGHPQTTPRPAVPARSYTQALRPQATNEGEELARAYANTSQTCPLLRVEVRLSDQTTTSGATVRDLACGHAAADGCAFLQRIYEGCLIAWSTAGDMVTYWRTPRTQLWQKRLNERVSRDLVLSRGGYRDVLHITM